MNRIVPDSSCLLPSDSAPCDGGGAPFVAASTACTIFR